MNTTSKARVGLQKAGDILEGVTPPVGNAKEPVDSPTRTSWLGQPGCHMDRNSRKRRLDRFASNERIFRGGKHETCNCTACARIITARFGGEVRGYCHEDNPTARVGESEFGHDFAITSDRFLVDPWLFHYYGDPPVLDMDVLAERDEAFARYGPEKNWKRLPDLPGTPASQIRKARCGTTPSAG